MLFIGRAGRTALASVGGLALLAAGFVGGYLAAGGDEESGATTFHDTRVLTPASLQANVVPGDPSVLALARRLGTPEAAYRYVRDGIAYDPSLPAASPADAMQAGAASCLSKAALLASIYRAQGMDDDAVRVVTGQVRTPEGLMEHAWLEVEHGGRCLQQDPSALLGSFAFDQFEGTAYTRAHVRRELFCFNDRGFAVVSQRNRFRGMQDPHMLGTDAP
jgi:hypothetical protein